MTRTVLYGDIEFDVDFVSAMTQSGKMLNFTRQERNLLIALSSKPDTIHSRETLLDKISDRDSGA